MKEVFRFEDWAKAQHIDEAAEAKDIKRIEDIATKADDDEKKMASLATTMANAITDKGKALRRAEAADQVLGVGNVVSPIFYQRAKDLGATVDTASLKASTAAAAAKEDAPKAPAPKPEKPVPVETFEGRKSIGKVYLIPYQDSNYQEIYQYWSGREWNWYRDVPRRTKDAGFFYMKVTKVGFMWVEGDLLQTNCVLKNSEGFSPNKKVRVKIIRNDKRQVTSILAPGPEYKIFTDNKEKIAEVMKKSYFIDGKESYITNNAGGKALGVIEGEYIPVSYNFELTQQAEEPVLVMIPKSLASGKKEDAEPISVKLSDFESMSKELTEPQKEVIAEWFSKEIGAEVKYEKDRWGSSYSFKVSTFTVNASKGKGYLASFAAGPFLTRQEAEDYVKEVKEKEGKRTFSSGDLTINKCSHYSRIDLTLDQLIEYANLIGIKVTIKDLLNVKRGQVIARDFGV